MTLDYSVSFEFETRPPLTHRGTVAATSAGTCAARAMRHAQKALRPIGWTSVVCLLLKPQKTAPGETNA
jgi:hypothetical protein